MGEKTARVFAGTEYGLKLIISAVEVEAALKTEYLAKLKIDDRNKPDPSKLPHGWTNKDEDMKFLPILLYPEFFNYLMFFPSEVDSNDLNDYKNTIAYNYKSGWLQPMLYHNLTGNSFSILKGECRKSLK